MGNSCFTQEDRQEEEEKGRCSPPRPQLCRSCARSFSESELTFFPRPETPRIHKDTIPRRRSIVIHLTGHNFFDWMDSTDFQEPFDPMVTTRLVHSAISVMRDFPEMSFSYVGNTEVMFVLPPVNIDDDPMGTHPLGTLDGVDSTKLLSVVLSTFDKHLEEDNKPVFEGKIMSYPQDSVENLHNLLVTTTSLAKNLLVSRTARYHGISTEGVSMNMLTKMTEEKMSELCPHVTSGTVIKRIHHSDSSAFRQVQDLGFGSMEWSEDFKTVHIRPIVSFIVHNASILTETVDNMSAYMLRF